MTTENTAQTIQFSELTIPPQKEENFFEKGVKKVIGFIAKATGQPDPESGKISSSPISAEKNLSLAESSSFFEKLVSSTQSLLNKTEDLVNNVVDKTENLTQNIREVPEKVVEKTNTVIDKGLTLGEEVKSTAEIAVNSFDFGKNLKTTMNEWVKFAENPLQKAEEIWKGVVISTTNLGKHLGEQIKDVGSASLEQLTGGVQNLGWEVKQFGEQLPLGEGGIWAPVTNFIGAFKEKGKDALATTKEIWKNVVESTRDLVKNPIEYLDTLTGKGQEEAWTLQTETPNTTALETLEKAE